MLMTMKAYNEASRGLLYDTAAAGERAHRHPDEAGRREAANRVALLTPVAKAWCSDLGVAMTSIGVQVHGGVGYVEETGAAQHYRDARITPIYEGTNGIQAIDLVMRKLQMDDGAVVRSYLDEMAALDAPLAESNDPRFSVMQRGACPGRGGAPRSDGVADRLRATRTTDWQGHHRTSTCLARSPVAPT